MHSSSTWGGGRSRGGAATANPNLGTCTHSAHVGNHTQHKGTCTAAALGVEGAVEESCHCKPQLWDIHTQAHMLAITHSTRAQQHQLGWKTKQRRSCWCVAHPEGVYMQRLCAACNCVECAVGSVCDSRVQSAVCVRQLRAVCDMQCAIVWSVQWAACVTVVCRVLCVCYSCVQCAVCSGQLCGVGSGQWAACVTVVCRVLCVCATVACSVRYAVCNCVECAVSSGQRV